MLLMIVHFAQMLIRRYLMTIMFEGRRIHDGHQKWHHT